MTDDLETRLTTLLRERADDVDIDLDVCRARLAAAPTPRRGDGSSGPWGSGWLPARLGAGDRQRLVCRPTARPRVGRPASFATGVATTSSHGAAAWLAPGGSPRWTGDGWRPTPTRGHAHAGRIRVVAGRRRLRGRWWLVHLGREDRGFSPGDYTQPDRMPPARTSRATAPASLSAIWPGMRLLREGGDLRVVDGQDKVPSPDPDGRPGIFAPPRLSQLRGAIA